MVLLGNSLTPQERVERLEAACLRMGGKRTLGQLLGYKDGAYIGQMLRGERPITEKALAAFAEHASIADLFSAQAAAPAPSGLMEPTELVAQLKRRLQGCDENQRERIAAKLSAFAQAPDSWLLEQSLTLLLAH